MKFILLKRVDGKQIAVNVASIVTVQAEDEDGTWIEISNGTKFMVFQFAAEIIQEMGAEIKTGLCPDPLFEVSDPPELAEWSGKW